jgi:hexosaminidase
VGTLWGVYSDVYCAGNDKTFQFLENVITEVVDLFPGKYIHIGGDEVPKNRWKNCPKCQARIKTENLKDEHGLQSYFVKRMEKFINSKGKKIIGWDEILEGGLAPEATVQSWRGVKGAIDAAKQGHDVIVSPTSNCYFDYPVDEIDLEKVYSFDPIPSELTKGEKKHVLGSEANMWTEYAPQELVDDRLFPRILALAEVVWTYPNERNFIEFNQRVQKHYDKLNVLDVNYGLETKPFELNKNFNSMTHSFKISINQLQKDLDLNLIGDNISAHKLNSDYENLIDVNSTENLNIYLTRLDKKVGKTFIQGFTFNKATDKNVQLKFPYSENYSAGGPDALTDGVRGSDSFRGGDKSWQGFLGSDLEATVDLGLETEISKIEIGFFQASSSWVVFPEYIEYFISNDGNNFEKVGRIDIPSTLRNPDWVQKDFTSTFTKQKAQYVKIFAKNLMELPYWHPSAGNKSWLMTDEIIVE